MAIYLHKHVSPYNSYGLGEVANLTSNWQRFEYIFIASGFSGTTWDGRLRLWFSGKTGTFQLDDVSITPVGVAAATMGREASSALRQAQQPGRLYLPAVANQTGSVQAAAIDATTTTVTKYYYFGTQRVAMAKGGEFRYLHGDHLGSTVMETNLSGAVITDQKYYAFGSQRDSGPVATDHKFTGQKLDGSGLYYYNARYYDPTIGQFVSPDTIVPDPENVLAYNRYMYALGNPLKFVDSSGNGPHDPGPKFDPGPCQTGIGCVAADSNPIRPYSISSDHRPGVNPFSQDQFDELSSIAVQVAAAQIIIDDEGQIDWPVTLESGLGDVLSGCGRLVGGVCGVSAGGSASLVAVGASGSLDFLVDQGGDMAAYASAGGGGYATFYS